MRQYFFYKGKFTALNFTQIYSTSMYKLTKKKPEQELGFFA